MYDCCAKEMCGEGVDKWWRNRIFRPSEAKVLITVFYGTEMLILKENEKEVWVTRRNMWRGSSPSYPHDLWITFVRTGRRFPQRAVFSFGGLLFFLKRE